MCRGTGGNQFVAADASIADLVEEVRRGLVFLAKYAERTGREMDLGAITVNTSRALDGRISVQVMGDLRATEEPADA